MREDSFLITDDTDRRLRRFTDFADRITDYTDLQISQMESRITQMGGYADSDHYRLHGSKMT
jgi:hypothetical protein